MQSNQHQIHTLRECAECGDKFEKLEPTEFMLAEILCPKCELTELHEKTLREADLDETKNKFNS